ncbi:MAG: DegT/DnrJ/EryC1/StrS family aminotransferase [Acidobacteriota bacterium]
MNRRCFLSIASAAGAAAGPATLHAAGERPALLGGKPVRTESFPSWPKFDRTEEQALLDVLRSGKWYRGSGKNAERFEAAYAKLMGARHCLATANGTSALFTSLNALGVGPGDEVILPPYTFVACVNVVLLLHALPVFVDTDPETFQIDARKIEAAITGRTRAIMPVHLGGSAVDLEAVLATARKHKLPVVEDACQSHLAEWRGRRVGTYGATGCFSFQASKNLNSGEGGAILTDDGELAERCYAFHNNGRGRRIDSYDFSYKAGGANLRMTEFQAALLMAQMTRLEEQSKIREQNAQYLTSLLREIPGLRPARMYEGCTRNAYHLYMFRYAGEAFAGLPRARFLKALAAEGIPASGGYSPLNKEPFLKNTLDSRGYQAVYPRERIARWEERNRCPENDRLCQEAVWLTQNMLLGSRRDMEQIAEAARKIQAHAAELARA